MAASSLSVVVIPSTIHSSSTSSYPSSLCCSLAFSLARVSASACSSCGGFSNKSDFSSSHSCLSCRNTSISSNLVCRAAEYKFPDPIPGFAEAETEKFRVHLLQKLSRKDLFGDSLDEVVGICTEGPGGLQGGTHDLEDRNNKYREERK